MNDILPSWSWWLYKHSLLGNVAYCIAFAVIFILFMKVYLTKDGMLRLHILNILVSLLFHTFIMTWFYNPMFNQWLQDASRLPIIMAFGYACWYLIHDFGIPGRKK